MVPTPTIDFETYSEAGFVWDAERNKWTCLPNAPQGKKGLPIVGAAVYAEHPTAEVLTLSYDLCDGLGVERWQPGLPLPQRLFDHLAAGRPIEAHNAMFERLIWEKVAAPKYGFPPLDPYLLRCSMATARVNNLPGALGNLGDVLNLDTKKDKDGKRLIDKFSVPRNPTKGDPRTRITPADDPEDAERLYGYCDGDVRSEMAAAERMEPMSADELHFWLIDQEINHRGLGVDRAGIRDCIAVLGEALAHYGAECVAITGGLEPGQLAELRGWMAGQGVTLPDMQADTVELYLKRAYGLPPTADRPAIAPLPAPVRRVLEIRSLIGSASVKKLYAMEYQTAADNRLRNLIVHHGARTGRPTGEGPQPLNLPKAGPKLVTCGACGKPHKKATTACPWCYVPCPPIDRKGKWAPDMVPHVLEIMAHRSLGLVEWFFGDALLAIMGCVRGLFVAAEGNDLIASDYSAIEAVVAAMISGETWREKALRDKRDIYLMSASKITGTPYDAYLAYAAEHGENHPDRQNIGKVAELACLSPHTQVLTDRGLVRMGAIRTTDKVWDGVEWVRHAGLIERGRRITINLDGVAMTSDHKIICGRSWKAASELGSSSSSLSRALASGSERLPSFVPSGAIKTGEFSFGVTAENRNTRSLGRTCAKENRRRAVPARDVKRAPIGSSIMGTPISWPMTNTAAGCSIESPLASRGASLAAQTKPTATMQAGAFAYSSPGERERPVSGPSLPTSSLCPGGTFPSSKWTGSTRKGTMSPETSNSRRGRPARKGRSSICRPSSTTMRRVCDLANVGPRNRFTIKTDSGWLIVHNCGYGGWEGAWRAFDPDEGSKSTGEIEGIIRAWRDASPQIVAHWGGQKHRFAGRWIEELYGIEGAVIQAIQYPGTLFTPQPPSGSTIRPFPVEIGFVVRDDILRMLLPSGREIKYWNPRLAPSAKRPGTLEISYMTWNSNPKYGALGWVRMATWGSRVYENADQAIAHDIMRGAVIRLRAHGYPTVLHVYDEVVGEVPADTGSIEQFEQLMAPTEEYCRDWPIRASGGWRGKRYRKG